MNVYVNTSFTGHYPVGTAALVVAEDESAAAVLLQDALGPLGLAQPIEADSMQLLDTSTSGVVILRDGDY